MDARMRIKAFGCKTKRNLCYTHKYNRKNTQLQTTTRSLASKNTNCSNTIVLYTTRRKRLVKQPSDLSLRQAYIRALAQNVLHHLLIRSDRKRVPRYQRTSTTATGCQLLGR